MADSFMELQVERAVQSVIKDKVSALMRSVGKMAAKQGGGSVFENYQLLGKRTLAVLGVAAVAVQLAAFAVSRKREEQRIERVVRRVLEEERQNAEADD